jgi:hypothetical protein
MSFSPPGLTPLIEVFDLPKGTRVLLGHTRRLML